MRPIRPGEAPRWNALVRARHYLGLGNLVGESLKYVAEVDGQWVALLGWAAAALQCGPRDRRIGWSGEQRSRRRRFVANNARFLLLTEPGVANLASRVLALNTRRLAADWVALFGHPVRLAESFVDPARFRGGCYRAAGWLELGRTRGYGRNAGESYFHGHAETVWVRVLHRRARRWLAADFDVPTLQAAWGGKGVAEALVDLNEMPLEGRQGLFGRLRASPDVRKARGQRHELESILAVAVGAVVCGARSFSAIGEWSEHLSVAMRRRLHCRRQPETGAYQSPSEPTLRRTLQRIDAEALDRVVNEWMAGRHRPQAGTTLP